MVCAEILRVWVRQPERRDAEASRARDNAAQALNISALRVAAAKPMAASPHLDDASASPSARFLAIGFAAATQAIPIPRMAS